MRRSGIRRIPALLWRLCCSVLPASALLCGTAWAQLGGLQPPGRFVDVVDVSDREAQADITVQFTCSMHYLTHLPASEGSEVRIQLQPLPDCGVNPLTQISGETAPISGGGAILNSVRIEQDAPAQVTLVVRFRKSERFVMAQGVDPRGLRIRLLDRAPSRAKVMVNESPDTVSNFAINLDSQTEPFDEQTLQLAHERLQAPVFVSEASVEGQKWYRLRAGPIQRQSDAQHLLDRALQNYPRAWIAMGDDEATSDAGAAEGALPPVQSMGSDPPLDAQTLKGLLAEARSAMTSKDYPRAIGLLTKLQRQPEFPGRASAQELLGLARERSGQLAHAKAEYQEYLRHYPQGEGADRVATRLRILRQASAQAHGGPIAEIKPESPWQVNGGVAELLRYDGTRVNSTTTTSQTPVPLVPSVFNASQTTRTNASYTDVDLFARRRGESLDFLSRVSAGYARDFGASNDGTGTPGSFTRVSLASVELIDHPLGLLARFGRQISSQEGILGAFDGLFASYQFRPAWSVNVAAGYPVLQTNQTPQTDRHFETVALAYARPGSHWDGDVFASTQQFDGFRDRQAVGMDARFLTTWLSLIGLLDYDTTFHSINAAALMGSWQLPARWNVSFDAERRNSPVLTLYNALIGQPFTSLTQLEQLFSQQQIRQLAEDRTPVTSNYSVTATHPLGERFQFAAIVAATEIGAMPASGGVPAQPGTGLDLLYQAQLYATSLWRAGDFHLLTVGYGNTEVGKLESVGASSRFPVGASWRMGPRLTIERNTIVADSSTEITYIPSMLFDYQHNRSLLQIELGGELGKRDALVQSQDTKRYYISAAYRLNF